MFKNEGVHLVLVCMCATYVEGVCNLCPWMRASMCNLCSKNKRCDLHHVWKSVCTNVSYVLCGWVCVWEASSLSKYNMHFSLIPSSFLPPSSPAQQFWSHFQHNTHQRSYQRCRLSLILSRDTGDVVYIYSTSSLERRVGKNCIPWLQHRSIHVKKNICMKTWQCRLNTINDHSHQNKATLN